jgi:hypothetical protein
VRRIALRSDLTLEAVMTDARTGDAHAAEAAIEINLGRLQLH